MGAWAPSLGATGLTLRDESVYGNHGTLTNMDAASDWVVSGGKGALDFDGTDDRVTTTLKIGSWNAISYVIWVRPRITGQFQALVTNWNSDGEVFELFISNASDFVGSSFPFGVSFAATDNIWQHVALTRGSDTRLYVNGILQGTIANQSPISSIQNLTFGDRPTGGSYPLNGQMDDIRVYDRVLTPSEIRTLATRRGIAYESRRRLAVRSGAASPSGTLAKTLDGATLSSSGTLTAGASGTVTSTLDAATLASTGTVGSGVTATVSVTLAAATLSASGTLAAGLSGTVTRTLDNATLSATGGAAGSVTGSVSSTLAAVTCSATGTLAAGLSGSVTRTLADVVSSATGTLAAGASGSVTRTLADATLSSTGSFSAGLTASVNRALDSCVVSSTGTVANGATGSLSVQLASATLQSGNVALGGFRLKVAGEWKDAMAFVKVTGTWKSATPFVKVGGIWE